ncbi:MAG: CNP1-like family protein [Betaproteobacteria bacterium]|nr:CNP1-like family protein [Betaproteobacteria bacterium]
MSAQARAFFLAALAPLAALAQPSEPYYFPESAEEKPWEEQKLRLPPYPKDESLIKFQVSGATSFEFFIDPASVSVGKDGVIRYALLARSPSGAKNLSFEGIKCKGRESKIYAFGRPDGTWSQARDPKWARITGMQANRQHAALADDFFCPGRLIVRDAREAIEALKRGGHPRASTEGQMWNQPL